MHRFLMRGYSHLFGKKLAASVGCLVSVSAAFFGNAAFASTVPAVPLSQEPSESPTGMPAGPQNRFICPRAAGPVLLTNTSTAFDENNAYWLAWAALQAYSPGPMAVARLAKEGLPNAHVIERRFEGLQGFIASNEDFVLVSLRGTDEPRDVLMDLSFDQKPDTAGLFPGKVHEGFQAALDSGWDEIKAEIEVRAAGGKPVYFAGHSLGGAMVSIAALRSHMLGFNVAKVYLQSPPRIGNAEFAAFFNEHLKSKTLRFVVDQDVVPRLPPAAEVAEEFGRMIPGPLGQWATHTFRKLQYSHIGQQMVFNASGSLQGPVDFQEGNDRDFWKMVFQRSNGQALFSLLLRNSLLIIDHLPSTNFCYLANARKAKFDQSTQAHQAAQAAP